MKNNIISTIVLMIIALLIVGCNQQNTTQPIASPSTSAPAENPEGNNNVVMINHFVFEPSEITIGAGETVAWKHNDNVAHKIVSEELFESNVMNRGDQFTYTFDKPGEYSYYCSIHPSMTGKIIVK